jgi:hypothetical protein
MYCAIFPRDPVTGISVMLASPMAAGSGIPILDWLIVTDWGRRDWRHF